MRDDTVPGVNKIGFPPTKEWDGVTYAHPIVYQDFSTRAATGENTADRGYVVHKRNSWKVRYCTQTSKRRVLVVWLHSQIIQHQQLEGARISWVGVGGCVLEMEVVPKVSGFDLSRIMREGATHHSTHTMGTITHQAPGAGGTVGWDHGW